MTSHTNLKRAFLAERALSTYQDATGCPYDDQLGHLLRDLMHWAPICGFDFNLELNCARRQFETEVRS